MDFHYACSGVDVKIEKRWRKKYEKREDCVRSDMCLKGVNTEITTHRGMWKRNKCCASLN